MANDLSNDLKQKFLRLCGALSPENLCCDGELSAAEVRVKERGLRREWAALEREAGRKVSEDEIWSWCIMGDRN